MQGVEDPVIRDCCLLPWFPDKLTDEEWIKQLSTETTMESARSQLREIHLKVCLCVEKFVLIVKRLQSTGLYCTKNLWKSQ